MENKTKLIKKTSRTFLWTGLFLAILSSIVLYFYTKNLLREEVEEVLYSTEARIVDALEKETIVFSLPPVTEIRRVEELKPQLLKDTVIFDPSQNELEVFRELSTFREIHNQNYQITVRNLVVESKDILLAIVISNITIFIFAFLFLFYFNTRRNIQLWSPFFKNLEQMKKFSLTSPNPVELVESDVLEFSELKKEIHLLTNKVRTDYENLKQFTENVAHEIQTPLAIIQAKIDNIINEHPINDRQFEQITSIQKDIQRLKQLNKKITILSKIDNNQFLNIVNVNISELINEKLESFKELDFDTIDYQPQVPLWVSIDPFLADVLINNLITNAIKHSKKDEKVVVETDKNSFIISNNGERSLAQPEKLFQRFYREDNATQSTGLGLAIVKKICDYYNFKISYQFKSQKHFFSIEF